MNHHVQRYFSDSLVEGEGHFFRVIPLHEELYLDWEEAHKLSPRLPRGWYELSRLKTADRLEFVRGFWFATLPYFPQAHQGLAKFFAMLDDIGIYLIQERRDGPFEPELVYSEVKETSFFHGLPPATAADLEGLTAQFVEHQLPADYLAFLKIHNGFSKVNDTGLIRSGMLSQVTEDFQQMLISRGPPARPGSQGEQVNPSHLIPFYQSFGMDCFQCFYTEWYPQQEMGNLYYSGVDHVLSDHTDSDNLAENQAFPTFVDWLAFYVETLADEE